MKRRFAKARPVSEHFVFVDDRITLVTKPHRYHGEPGLRGFVLTGSNFLGAPIYRAVYKDDPEEELDIVNNDALAAKRDPLQRKTKPPFVVLS